MADDIDVYDWEDSEEQAQAQAAFKLARTELIARCKAASIPFAEGDGAGFRESYISVTFPSGRGERRFNLYSAEAIRRLLSSPFEKYCFLKDYEGICSYELGVIEVGIRSMTLGAYSMYGFVTPLFNVKADRRSVLNLAPLIFPSPQEGQPQIEIGLASDMYWAVTSNGVNLPKITLKLIGCNVKTQSSAIELLEKISGALFFQIDKSSDLQLTLERQRTGVKRPKVSGNLRNELEYPQTQYDDAPLKLYTYGRSAIGMPLLQFLAYYQVIEFFFPRFSQTDAHRRIQAILKDPTFRATKDSDISKVLSAISISRSGSFGDERSQLKSTLLTCLDPDQIRGFFDADSERKEFFSAKQKAKSYHKIPLGTEGADLRADVAERIYDIRCKIVHTKNDSRDGVAELLLPFTQEAEQLAFDIALVRFVAQAVLISTSMPLNIHI